MDAFEPLLAAGRTAVERWVKARIASPADAEDVLQETYMAAFQGFDSLRDSAAFLPWILGIARRKCADWYRAQARRREVPLDALPETAAEPPADSAVEETLEALPPRDQLMLSLFYRDMLSQKQIARRLGVPEGTVKSRMSAARSRFRAAYPYPPKGEIHMKNTTALPDRLPEYAIVWTEEAPFPVDCHELMGWFIRPRLGETLRWGMYDLPSRKLDVSYLMEVTGPASVHGLEGVSISAKVIPPKPALPEDDLMKEPVDASTGGQEAWTFIAQEKDGFTRFLSAEHLDGGVRTLTTFLDGEAFMDNWGLGEDNRGMPVHLTPQGKIQRRGDAVVTTDAKALMDVVGRCQVTLDGVTHDTVCLMDLGLYDGSIVSEQFIDREGRTVLWRRFNRDDWAMDRYGQRWSELLPENERITVNGQVCVHWYDCLCAR